MPQTDRGVPPGGQSSVTVSFSVIFSEVAVASQVVGVAAGFAKAGAEVDGELTVWPPPPASLCLPFSNEHPVQAVKSTTPISKNSGTFDRYEDITETFLSVWRKTID